MPKIDEAHIALGGAGDADHVVEAHDHVGDDDDPDRFQERGAVTDVALASASSWRTSLMAIQTRRKPPTDLQERDAASRYVMIAMKASRSRTAPAVPQRRPEKLLPLRQRADRQRDDQRVIAGERQVDQHDLAER